ncbi:4'-phosphopantetheinyl transferase family protein [Desulfovibrio piger]|uniref:4'-phosphopantetheinyl transferase family protein n=1 Tax=Desulfovibrio piger TaxID=901 RepID=UPI00241CB431|nr:4'-phosphopantetheinyl transferase family protein [Desulfovibrio piger]
MSRPLSSSPLPPLLLAACPLPSCSGQPPAMQLPELPEGLTAAEDRAHMTAFRLPAERDKRHLARLLLAVLLHRAAVDGLSPLPSLDWHPLPRLFHHAAQARRFFARHACPRLHRLPSGRPWLEGFSVSFSYSEQAAFCLLAGPGTSPGVDAEALTSPAPPASAFSPRELSSCLSPAARQRECLRRWTIKEAVFKAAGTGCDRPPRLLDSGHNGQRTGDLMLDAARYRWRMLPCPSHWLCVAVRG